MKRVLVVDDNYDVRTMLQALLEQAGFGVSLAADGAEALALQRAAPFDVVITDIFMPGKEGIETIAELRREFPQTRIIALTGGSRVGSLDYLAVARELGAAKVFLKPVPPKDLIAAVRELASSE